MRLLPPRVPFLSALVLAAALAGCATAPPPEPEVEVRPDRAERIERARRLIDEGRPLAAVRIYRDLAEAAEPAEAQRWRLRIVELLFDRGYPELALEWQRELGARPVPPELRVRKQIIDARAAVELRQGLRALRLLPAVEAVMDEATRARILDLQAEALALAGYPAAAIDARVRRGQLLTTDAEIRRNHERILALLRRLPRERLEDLATAEGAPVRRGWAELGLALRRAHMGEQPVGAALDQWLVRFPGHPAADAFVADLRERVLAELTYPERIALLLPLSGKLSDAARAVRDGLLAAYYDQPGTIRRPAIEVIDTGVDGLTVPAAYDRALANGASFVIGPLSKDGVARLAERASLEVPALTLNYLPGDDTATPAKLYQFGLLPEDEARQAAEAAIQNGHYNAVALVPAGAWGGRMLAAFSARYEELGGVLLESSSYNSRASDHGRPIQALLNLDRSRGRERRLQSALGQPVHFEPRRRRDVDIVFMAAMPRQARLLEPQLEFHRAGDVPAYASSHVFSGTPEPNADWDMNGLFFTEIPWILDNLDHPRPLHRRVSQAWPSRHDRAPRLYALGIDAFSLLPHIDRLAAGEIESLSGRTGQLTIDGRHRFHRQLRWAIFVEGVPVPVPGPGAGVVADTALGRDVRERADDE